MKYLVDNRCIFWFMHLIFNDFVLLITVLCVVRLDFIHSDTPYKWLINNFK
jgi:hypothetical protein